MLRLGVDGDSESLLGGVVKEGLLVLLVLELVLLLLKVLLDLSGLGRIEPEVAQRQLQARVIQPKTRATKVVCHGGDVWRRAREGKGEGVSRKKEGSEKRRRKEARRIERKRVNERRKEGEKERGKERKCLCTLVSITVVLGRKSVRSWQ
jgi:hypothetical protein